jgi:ABC-type dipeptide/oligopeptide/nickel transport system ATPase component
MDLLTINNLSVSFPLGARQRAVAVDGLCAVVRAERTLAIVGESGSGKSITALAAMGLLPKAARIDSGSIMLHAGSQTIDLLAASEQQLRRVRGKEIAMIFQEPMTSLNPVLSVGEQLEESLLLHQRGLSRAQRRQRIESVLREVGMEHAVPRLNDYPHQFSGGMRQRIMIAMALICEPRVLLADEPTTALDVTVQAQVLALLRSIREQRGLGVVLITHDLGVVRAHAHDVCVMYAGRIVEAGPTSAIFASPTHPYTRALLACVPRLRQDAPLSHDQPAGVDAPRSRPRLATVRELLEGGSLSDERWRLPTGQLAWWPTRTNTAPATPTPIDANHWVLTVRA